MSDTQTADNTPSNSQIPTPQKFVSVVTEHPSKWEQSVVGGLCVEQTGALIGDLALLYHVDAEPDIRTFRQVFHDFQERKDRTTFAELTEPELQELVAELAPHFQSASV